MSTYSFDQAMDIMQTKSEANSSTYNVDLNFMLQLPSPFEPYKVRLATPVSAEVVFDVDFPS